MVSATAADDGKHAFRVIEVVVSTRGAIQGEVRRGRVPRTVARTLFTGARATLLALFDATSTLILTVKNHATQRNSYELWHNSGELHFATQLVVGARVRHSATQASCA